METAKHDDFARTWREIVAAFLRLGATSYGGPAIMGIMQAELQERRRWVSRERFVEGLSLVNMLPGATATQLGIFLGYARGGWWGGMLGGLCFVLPAFFVMLTLTITYGVLGVTPVMRGALYGLGPVVLAVFLVAVYRLGRTTARSVPQAALVLGAAAASIFSALGVAPILLLAGGAGLLLFHSKRSAALVVGVLTAGLAVIAVSWWSTSVSIPVIRADVPSPASLAGIATYFFTVGALTVGGGLAMIAFIQAQVVDTFHWLTPSEFIDGLALGQFTPGPILMVAAYVGYKVAGVAGAAVAAAAAFLPSFILMLTVLPVLDRVRTHTWLGAAMKGIGPAVIGVLAVSLVRLAPYALPDLFAVAILIATLAALLVWRLGTLRVMIAGSLLGILRGRWLPLSGVKAARELSFWMKS